MTIVLPILLLIFFLLFGMPIALALGIAGSIGLIINEGWQAFFGVIQTAPYDSVESFVLSAIPMFILMAAIMTVTGLTKDLFYSAHQWLGNLPGGLGIATVFAGAGMGATSGSSTASAATMASAAYPEMKRYKYSTPFAMGVVSISGTLAVMIPPSIILIMYGILSEVGVATLLIAGIIPGILTAIGYIVTILIWVKIKPEDAPTIEDKPTMLVRFQSIKYTWPVLLLIFVVVGAIYTGVITPTEAGAVGAFTVLLLAIFMRRFSLKSCNKVLLETLKSTTMILTIIIGAMIFGYFLTITGATQNLVTYIEGLDVSRYVILSIIVAVFLVLGFFLDQMAILILMVPITFPIVIALGFNPIWFGILVTKAAEIGLVTPPVGMNVFVASGAAGVKTTESFKGVIWFVVTDLIILLLLMGIPEIATWLPETMNN
ncbi:MULTISPECIES: TRAP transporter large permease [Virgibacillus]|uniref:Neu5Ac permease n=1 Tax=Virgibacillus massiliensis TaxID=1462526 RepID=A0A024Q9I1_9BACI|nr:MULTISPECIES: TRAP transporter large permease subunit [Virgibacillus]CDQ38591.1 Neu5Ac permease [Virgibacillus massiliensis]